MVHQIRCESKMASDKAEDSSDRSTNRENADAAMLFMQKNRAAKEKTDESERQTVRPPEIPNKSRDSGVQARTQSSSVASEETRNQSSTTVEQVVSLTDEEDTQLEGMRAQQEEIRAALSKVLRQFAAPIRYAFAYGSGVYKQSGYGATSKPMVDLIFAVSHPDHWHALNISQNRSHYSFMGTLGSNAVAFVQDRMGAGVYYNPFVEVDGMLIKYGVVSMDTLSSDLLNWDSLYLAGRMQKPTLTLRRDPLMRISKQVNLTHAVRAALLMLPKNFSTEQLFRTIAALSFYGDFRMRVGGENPRKVDNIVEAQMLLFKYRYSSIIEGLPNLEYIGKDLLQQNMSPVDRAAMLRKMPNNFYDKLVRQGRKAGIKLPPGFGAEKVNTEKLVAVDNIGQITTKAIESIVALPALTQSAKGILSSGLTKSISYMYAKNKKSRSTKE
ncbi:Mitochondrial translocator assembly and maintenance protein 41 [Coemansia guatemalensis]|uniref:Phosphatidate cytidylyltransferase, mitochondrial n=1 Tax=Coemansia guatemalensis TaxID=2761395 RepID=A0A9W8HVE3_9FUNG|nr:Mitochondrial translocator assembly and maintenance protein 41 [Coemansia guatemalensis]